MNWLIVAAVLALVGGCAAEVAGEQSADVDTLEAALEGDDGALHPDCADYRTQCFENGKDKEKHCEKYSERCEVRIGSIGDSLTDEYQGFVNLPARQWTSQVQDDPRITFGDVVGSPEPRNGGYGLNWARFAQAALDTQWNSPEVQAIFGGTIPDPRWVDLAPFQIQVDGLSAQIAAGEVDVATVWVGHNDLFIRGRLGLPVDGAFVGALVGRIVTAAAQLQAAGDAKVVIIGIAGSPTDIAPINAALAGAAAAAGIAFINPFETVITELLAGYIDVGGTVLYPFSPDTASYADLAVDGDGPCAIDFTTFQTVCATAAYATSYRQHDGVHPNTIYSGLLGNEIITGINGAFGFNMRTTPEAQLLTNAGL